MLTGTTFQKELVPLRGKNKCKPHPQNGLLVLFRITNDHAHQFYVGVPPPWVMA